MGTRSPSSCTDDVIALGDVDGDGRGDALLVWHVAATNDDRATLVLGGDERASLARRATWVLPPDDQL